VSQTVLLEAIIVPVFASAPREAMIERLNKARIAFGRLSDMDDLMVHPQNRYVTVQTSSGEIELLAPGTVVRGQKSSFGPVPTLGQHDKSLRAEFGAAPKRGAA
jgi:crotonobetainyl-CoA:carnitine CoA-transferase CaiB-like acyl-CoA transferase